jgi:hypothetical protein
MATHESASGWRDESPESLPGLTLVVSADERNPPDVGSARISPKQTRRERDEI